MKPSNDLDRLTLPDVLALHSTKRGIVIIGQRQPPAADERATSARSPDILNPEFRRRDVTRHRRFCEIKHCPAASALRLFHRRPGSFPDASQVASIGSGTPGISAGLSV
jgi:hypothetical protein